MSKKGKAMRQFIDKIPDSKLEGGFGRGTVHNDFKNFRLDNQGLTTAKNGEVQKYNLQMQVNYSPIMTSLEAMAPDTVAAVLVPVYPPTFSAAQIKDMLMADLIRRKH
ncbi:uncharacterized protein EKO05_0001702 [Ascochyta rabiei]|uniref:Uncharacterized protein n=1 Tax=Didymella rabiei TaxID=5454 RepID=A0A163BFL9_DIDRA|nr:uncharacterized protein EKO05_0001702 [Ascochyta rabiei]KZM21747.1 hypothetical protein ST47_g7099 [Ascochyta rabiei]UPX11078.1 hypothetical protein EKO05_0001702 [Ascochyta rabiei]